MRTLLSEYNKLSGWGLGWSKNNATTQSARNTWPEPWYPAKFDIAKYGKKGPGGGKGAEGGGKPGDGKGIAGGGQGAGKGVPLRNRDPEPWRAGCKSHWDAVEEGRAKYWPSGRKYAEFESDGTGNGGDWWQKYWDGKEQGSGTGGKGTGGGGKPSGEGKGKGKGEGDGKGEGGGGEGDGKGIAGSGKGMAGSSGHGDKGIGGKGTSGGGQPGDGTGIAGGGKGSAGDGGTAKSSWQRYPSGGKESPEQPSWQRITASQVAQGIAEQSAAKGPEPRPDAREQRDLERALDLEIWSNLDSGASSSASGKGSASGGTGTAGGGQGIVGGSQSSSQPGCSGDGGIAGGGQGIVGGIQGSSQLGSSGPSLPDLYAMQQANAYKVRQLERAVREAAYIGDRVVQGIAEQSSAKGPEELQNCQWSTEGTRQHIHATMPPPACPCTDEAGSDPDHDPHPPPPPPTTLPPRKLQAEHCAVLPHPGNIAGANDKGIAHSKLDAQIVCWT